MSKENTLDYLNKINEKINIKEFTNKGIPIFFENISAINNTISRSSLFSMINKKREYVKEKEIYCLGDNKIFFTGYEFNLFDQDVLLRLINLGSKKKPYYKEATKEEYINNIEISFNKTDFLKSLNYSRSGERYKLLDESLSNIHSSVIIIEDKNIVYRMHILEHLLFVKNLSKYFISFNNSFYYYFLKNNFGYINLEKRKYIQNNSMSKWLQSYFASNSPGLNKISIIKLMKLYNYNSEKHKFKLKLLYSLNELSKLDVIYKDFKIEDDILIYKIIPIK